MGHTQPQLRGTTPLLRPQAARSQVDIELRFGNSGLQGPFPEILEVKERHRNPIRTAAWANSRLREGPSHTGSRGAAGESRTRTPAGALDWHLDPNSVLTEGLRQREREAMEMSDGRSENSRGTYRDSAVKFYVSTWLGRSYLVRHDSRCFCEGSF